MKAKTIEEVYQYIFKRLVREIKKDKSPVIKKYLKDLKHGN